MLTCPLSFSFMSLLPINKKSLLLYSVPMRVCVCWGGGGGAYFMDNVHIRMSHEEICAPDTV